jgi:hypothetical protein
MNFILFEHAGEMLDALRQWKWAEENNDAQELANARFSRDEVIAKAEAAGIVARTPVVAE